MSIRQFIVLATVVCGLTGGLFCYLVFGWLQTHLPAWYPSATWLQMITCGMLSAGLAAWWKEITLLLD